MPIVLGSMQLSFQPVLIRSDNLPVIFDIVQEDLAGRLIRYSGGAFLEDAVGGLQQASRPRVAFLL